MELIVIVTLCISLSVLLTPCASQQLQVQSSHDQAQGLQVSPLCLPRKLILNEAAIAKVDGGKELLSYSKQRGALSEKQQHIGGGRVHGRAGTWREWAEKADKSEFFTMDYSHVRRQRPIHNKSVPVGP